jgi:hypothetical protein
VSIALPGLGSVENLRRTMLEADLPDEVGITAVVLETPSVSGQYSVRF